MGGRGATLAAGAPPLRQPEVGKTRGTPPSTHGQVASYRLGARSLTPGKSTRTTGDPRPEMPPDLRYPPDGKDCAREGDPHRPPTPGSDGNREPETAGKDPHIHPTPVPPRPPWAP